MNKEATPPAGEPGAEQARVDVSMPLQVRPEVAIDLAPHHLKMLRVDSGITNEVITARGYRTITNAQELAALGFAPSQCKSQQIPGLLLPLHTTDGGNGLYVYRPDNPRVFEDKRKHYPDGTWPNRVIKYETPKGAGIRLDCPPPCRSKLADPRVPLWVTEGQKKADALASRDLCAVALLGVWNFKGTNEFGAVTFLADWDHIALGGRDVRIVFDSDVITKPDVRKALDRLIEHLHRKGAHVTAVYLPAGQHGKQGVDDYLAAGHSVDDLEALVESPRLEVKPADPVVALLDGSPMLIARPLALLNGVSFAATWLYVQITESETTNKKGEIIKLSPPRVTNHQQLFVVRGDGQIFGNGSGLDPIESIGAEVRLPEIPPLDRLWSTPGVKRYAHGQRPDPTDVFTRVVDIIGRFIDFDRSLATQQTMAEMVACYVLTTWFLDAFNLIGFLWPNGDRGSGKTQLLAVVAELAYLGHLILSGGSFAALRDMADYGATLAFDDAEGFSDPKKTDPDKRALLLAGNRRGNTVPVKEPNGMRGWRTRYVNTFCPRLFSATQLPDPILASRTIIIPLIRTPDKYRANADPSEYKLWPHDRRQLLDDLWALGLAYLPELVPYEAEVNLLATLTGRNLEPWRALLAVALWLDRRGVSGLWQRMESLSVNYQQERPELELGDMTLLVIRALVECANQANQANCANLIRSPQEWTFETAAITMKAKEIAAEQEIGIDADRVDSKRVGIKLNAMRVTKPPRPGGRGPRKWTVKLSDLRRLTMAYGVVLPGELDQLDQPHGAVLQEVGTLGEVGTVGTAQHLTDREVIEL